MLNQPLVSIIIPIYNVEKYLKDSVRSATNQTYKNIEIILVDDGSPDNCPQICDELKKTDERIKVIHKKNGGLSDARNCGMKEAIGDYIFFLDSDDTMVKNAIEMCLNTALLKNADIVLSQCYNKIMETNKTQEFRYHFPEEDFNSNAKVFATNILVGKGRAWRVHGVLYKSSVIFKHNCQFPLGRTSEDIIFNLQVYSYAEKIAYCSIPIINYLQREGSITNTFNKEFYNTILFIDNAVKNFFEKNNIDNNVAEKKRNSLFCRNVITYLFRIPRKNNGLCNSERKILYSSIVNNYRFKEAMKDKMEIPYFQNEHIEKIFILLQYLLRKKMYNTAYFLMQVINYVR